MRTVADAVRTIIYANPALHFGLHHQLLNLSQVARFIRPLVEARTKKDVTVSAIAMSLSRLQRTLQGEQPAVMRSFSVDRIHIHSGLCSLTLRKSRRTLDELTTLFNRIQDQEGYITFTEGTKEITTIIEQDKLGLARSVLTTVPENVHRQLAGIGVTFPEPYLETPGLLYQLLQQVAMQNINVVEITSTATEFNIYVDDAEARVVFDSIYNHFKKQRPDESSRASS